MFVARRLGFIVVNAVGCLAWMHWLIAELPTLRGDSSAYPLCVAPAIAIAVASLLAMHPRLLRQRTAIERASTFVGFFAASAVVYAAWIAFQLRAPGVLVVGPIFVAIYGAPLVFMLLVVNKGLGRWLCPRPASTSG